jgi:hypothetical protein
MRLLEFKTLQWSRCRTDPTPDKDRSQQQYCCCETSFHKEGTPHPDFIVKKDPVRDQCKTRVQSGRPCWLIAVERILDAIDMSEANEN